MLTRELNKRPLILDFPKQSHMFLWGNRCWTCSLLRTQLKPVAGTGRDVSVVTCRAFLRLGSPTTTRMEEDYTVFGCLIPPHCVPHH